MKHFPIVLLYLVVPVLGLVGANKLARNDRTVHLLREELKKSEAQSKEYARTLRHDFGRQIEVYETQIASLADELKFSLTTSAELQREVTSLRTKLNAETLARQNDASHYTNKISSLSLDLAETRSSILPLQRELTETKEQLAADIEREREARAQLSTKYDSAFATQGDLVDVLQQLASASRARAVAQQQIAEQILAEAEDIERLAQQATGATSVETIVQSEESIRVAEVVPNEDITPITTDAEVSSPEVATDAISEASTAELPVPVPPAPDA